MPPNNDEPKPRILGKTTYFLGAGFSAAAGIPTMPRFVAESFRLLKRYGPELLCKDLARIMNKYHAIAAGTETNVEDIQELFSLVSGNRPRHEGEPNEKECEILKAVIAFTLCYAHLEDECRMDKLKCRGIAKERKDEILFRKIVRQIEHDDQQREFEGRSLRNWTLRRTVPWRHLFPPKGQLAWARQVPSVDLLNCCIYEAFLSYVLNRSDIKNGKYVDVIVTPNYDLTVENANEQIKDSSPNRGKAKSLCQLDYGTKVHHQGRGKSKLKKLKLVKFHGSLNWYLNKNGEAFEWYPLKEVVLRSSGKECFRRLCERVPLIPPTWQSQTPKKDDVHHSQLFKTLQGDALRHLKEAERIVIIGYSMPKTDMHIKYLMSHALNTPDLPAIEIWDIADYEKMKERIEILFGKKLGDAVAYDKGGEKDGGLQGFVRKYSYTMETDRAKTASES